MLIQAFYLRINFYMLKKKIYTFYLKKVHPFFCFLYTSCIAFIEYLDLILVVTSKEPISTKYLINLKKNINDKKQIKISK